MSQLPETTVSHDAELAVLACITINEEARDRAFGQLGSDHFESPRHQAIFAAARTLKLAGQPVNRLTLRRQLEADRKLETAGGIEYLAQMTEFFPVAENINAYITLVIEGWRRRESLRLAMALARQLTDPASDAARVTSEYATKLAAVVGDDSQQEPKHWTERAIDHEDRQLDRAASGSGVGWPLPKLTALLGHLNGDALIGLGGLYSHGKTWLALQIAHYAARRNKRVKIYTYEMTTEQVSARLNWIETGINPRQVTDANRPAWNDGYYAMSKYPLWIEDRDEFADIDRVTIDMERSIRKFKTELFIFDYMRLMRKRGCNGPYEAIPEISMAFKQLVKKHGVDIIFCTQINKSVENQKRSPLVSDYEFGGNTDCDIGLVVNRPGRYLSREDFKGPRGAADYEARVPHPLYTEIKVGKNRNGQCGTIDCGFNPRLGLFVPRGEYENEKAGLD